jgi:hypothetical protein
MRVIPAPDDGDGGAFQEGEIALCEEQRRRVGNVPEDFGKTRLAGDQQPAACAASTSRICPRPVEGDRGHERAGSPARRAARTAEGAVRFHREQSPTTPRDSSSSASVVRLIIGVGGETRPRRSATPR